MIKNFRPSEKLNNELAEKEKAFQLSKATLQRTCSNALKTFQALFRVLFPTLFQEPFQVIFSLGAFRWSWCFLQVSISGALLRFSSSALFHLIFQVLSPSRKGLNDVVTTMRKIKKFKAADRILMQVIRRACRATLGVRGPLPCACELPDSGFFECRAALLPTIAERFVLHYLPAQNGSPT